MPKRFLIIDQNCYRDDSLAFLIENYPQVRFVIPDVAFVEMCKSISWESTIRQSLKILSETPNRVYAGITVGEAIRLEIKNRKTTSNRHLVCRRFTPVIRSLLREIQSGTNGSAFAKFHSQVGEIRKELYKEELNHQKNLRTLAELVKLQRILSKKTCLSHFETAALQTRKSQSLLCEARPIS